MRAVVSAKELKAALKGLRAIADSFHDAKDDAAYFFKVDHGKLTVQVFNGAYASFTLEADLSDVTEKPFGFDFTLVSSLKFPDDKVTLTFGDGAFRASAGSFLVELAALKCERIPKAKPVELTHEFPSTVFSEALSFHAYGYHHNPVEAAKRSIQVTTTGSHLLFQSFDRQVSAFSRYEFGGSPLEAPIHFLPKPVSVVLDSVSSDTFKLGVGKQAWGIEAGNLNVLYPNMIKTQSFDFTKILEDVKSKPCLMLKMDGKALAKSLDVLSPSVKAGKEENPKMMLCVGEKTYFELQSEKIKAMRIELEQCKIQEKDLPLSKEKIPVNYRYLKEFAENLAAGGETILQWWRFRDPQAPMNGRGLSLFNKSGRYIIARLSQ